MASQPARPWFRLSSMARPAGPSLTPNPAPAPTLNPATTPLARPTLRPLAPLPPAEPTPPSPPVRAPTTPPAPAPTLSPVVFAPAPLRPLAASSTTAPVPSSPARDVYSTPAAASPRTTIENLLPQQTYSPPKPKSTTISSASSAQMRSPIYNPSPINAKPANNTPPHSPNRLKPTSSLPSPPNLPPPQLSSNAAGQTDRRVPLDVEQKTMLVQNSVDQKPNSWFSTGASNQDHDLNRDSQKPRNHGRHHEEKINRNNMSSDSEVLPDMRIITLAGENIGAHMKLTQSSNKHHEKHSHYLYRDVHNGKSAHTANSHRSDNGSSSSTGDEGKPKMKNKSHRRGHIAGNSSHLPLISYTNSNVQGINNSILYNSSCTHHDPGVHFSLTRKSNGDGFNANGRHS